MSGLLAAGLLGLALAADAFAAALCQGAAARDHRPHATALAIGGAFGFAQGVAPLIGYAFGLAFAQTLAAIDHWVAFVILAALGGKLIHDGLKETGGAPEDAPKRARGWMLAGLAVATSVDAAAAGLTLPTLGLAPLGAAATIAAVTFVVCAAGVHLGRIAGATLLGGRAELIGGAVLILIGVKVLWDHGALRV